jgi:hypothetical protein
MTIRSFSFNLDKTGLEEQSLSQALAMSIAAEIEKLLKLREEGKLTADEFARAKEALLAGRPVAATQPTTGHKQGPKAGELFVRNLFATLVLAALVAGGWYLFGTDGGRNLLSSGTGITVTDKERIVGRWRTSIPFGMSRSMEFFPDGTFKVDAPLGSSQGRYRIVTQGKLEIEEGQHPGGVMVHDYKLSGDTLDALGHRWERVK